MTQHTEILRRDDVEAFAPLLPAPGDKTPLLEIKNLKMEFTGGDRPLRAVDDVSFTIGAGETVCLVGESGCGKSVTALSIARLVPSPPAKYVGGEILLNGHDVLKMSKPQLRDIRGGVVSYIFSYQGSEDQRIVIKDEAALLHQASLHRCRFQVDLVP